MGEHDGIQDDDARNGHVQEDDVPLWNPSVEAYGVGGDAVLHDSDRDRVFAVTALAWEVWKRCDGYSSIVDIARAINEPDEPPVREMVDPLRRITSRLSDQDLLFVPTRSIPGADATERDGPSDEGAVETLSVVFGDHRVQIRTNAPAFAEGARCIFRGMLGGDPGAPPGPETIDVLTAGRSAEQYYVQGAGGNRVEASTLEGALRNLKHAASRRFMEARSDLIWLHAGAATRDGMTVLVAGPWGSGKSTIVAHLCRSGWTYLSDDMAPYAPGSGTVFPFPTTIAYREAGEEQLSREELAGRPKTRVSLEPERIQDAPVQPDAVFFPLFDPDRPAEVNRQVAAEAAVSLVERCQNAGRHRGDAVRQLCRLADRIPVFRLRYNDRSDIPGLLTSTLR